MKFNPAEWQQENIEVEDIIEEQEEYTLTYPILLCDCGRRYLQTRIGQKQCLICKPKQHLKFINPKLSKWKRHSKI